MPGLINDLLTAETGDTSEALQVILAGGSITVTAANRRSGNFCFLINGTGGEAYLRSQGNVHQMAYGYNNIQGIAYRPTVHPPLNTEIWRGGFFFMGLFHYSVVVTHNAAGTVTVTTRQFQFGVPFGPLIYTGTTVRTLTLNTWNYLELFIPWSDSIGANNGEVKFRHLVPETLDEMPPWDLNSGPTGTQYPAGLANRWDIGDIPSGGGAEGGGIVGEFDDIAYRSTPCFPMWAVRYQVYDPVATAVPNQWVGVGAGKVPAVLTNDGDVSYITGSGAPADVQDYTTASVAAGVFTTEMACYVLAKAVPLGASMWVRLDTAGVGVAQANRTPGAAYTLHRLMESTQRGIGWNEHVDPAYINATEIGVAHNVGGSSADLRVTRLTKIVGELNWPVMGLPVTEAVSRSVIIPNMKRVGTLEGAFPATGQVMAFGTSVLGTLGLTQGYNLLYDEDPLSLTDPGPLLATGALAGLHAAVDAVWTQDGLGAARVDPASTVIFCGWIHAGPGNVGWRQVPASGYLMNDFWRPDPPPPSDPFGAPNRTPNSPRCAMAVLYMIPAAPPTIKGYAVTI